MKERGSKSRPGLEAAFEEAKRKHTKRADEKAGREKETGKKAKAKAKAERLSQKEMRALRD